MRGRWGMGGTWAFLAVFFPRLERGLRGHLRLHVRSGGGVVCARQEGWRIFGGGLSREIPPASKQGVFLAVAEYIPCTDRHNFYHHARTRSWEGMDQYQRFRNISGVLMLLWLAGEPARLGDANVK